MRIIFCWIFLLLGLIQRTAGQSNERPITDTITERIVEQVILFPQDKIHLHIDRPVYLAGETIWLRAHVADAVLHTPKSDHYVIAELINPLDSVVNRVKIRPESGAYCGHINLDQVLPEGDYTLRAWTESMLNPGADYHFRKQVRIEGPLSATVNTVVEFSYNNDNRYTAAVSFIDLKSHRKIFPDRLSIRVNRQVSVEVKTDRDTVSRFSFRLPSASDMRTLYIETAKSREYIAIPYPEKDYEVSFLPEGGYVPAGTECRVAFKALNQSGLPEDILVAVADSSGRILTRAETIHDGMGMFSLTAASGKDYFAICKNSAGMEKRYRLPAAREGICTISAEKSGDTLFISVLKSEGTGRQNLFLLLHSRGMIQYAQPWNDSFSTLAFDTGKFPSGILQAILFDASMKPVSERLVFCMGNDKAVASVTPDRNNYEKRQMVSESVLVTGPDGFPRTGSFSVSVTDNNDLMPDSSVTILTTLLLTSDLRGHINNPGFYFRKNDPVAEAGLDLLMMTNGWRRYDIPEVMAGNYRLMKYPPRAGMEIRGRVRTPMMGKPVKNSEVTAFSWGAGYIDVTRTDSAGCFAFTGIEFPDSTEFIIQALNKTGKPTVELILENEPFPLAKALPVKSAILSPVPSDESRLSSYLTRADTRYIMENGMRTVYIEEVIIKGKAPEKKDYSFSYYMPRVYQPSNNIIDYERIEELHPVFMSDIIMHIPFTRVVNGQVVIDRMRFSMNGDVPAVLVLDDMIIQSYNIDDIDPYSVERVAVLKGAQTTLLGGQGAHGAIVITTKKGMTAYKEPPRFNIKSVIPLGYQEPAEFYSPVYATEESRETGPPDLRTTLFWEPDVKVSTDGMAGFSFYTADDPSDYTVTIEGITDDGLIIRNSSRIVRSPE